MAVEHGDPVTDGVVKASVLHGVKELKIVSPEIDRQRVIDD
jgi:hypothetical protein